MRRLARRLFVLAVAILATGAAALAVFYRPANDGEPFAVVAIPPPPKAVIDKGAAALPMRESLKPDDETTLSHDAAALDGGEPIDPRDVDIIDPSTMRSEGEGELAGGMIADDGMAAATPVRLARAPFDGFTESSEFGPLPRIASDGRKPATVYARPYRGAESREGPVRIAILITGLGISASGTGEAIQRLPGAVSLAFAPYGDSLQSWVNRARSVGHEAMLQVPMEPFDYPDNDPGPHTLLTGLKSGENLSRLKWLLSRFGGFFGVTNYMGAKFTADDKALLPVMSELGQRGLVYLDDGASPRSRALPLAISQNVEARRADVIIDAGQSREAIEEALLRLEAVAKERGSAIGVGTALPVTIETVSEWAKTLARRGIALAPVSALLGAAES